MRTFYVYEMDYFGTYLLEERDFSLPVVDKVRNKLKVASFSIFNIRAVEKRNKVNSVRKCDFRSIGHSIYIQLFRFVFSQYKFEHSE